MYHINPQPNTFVHADRPTTSHWLRKAAQISKTGIGALYCLLYIAPPEHALETSS